MGPRQAAAEHGETVAHRAGQGPIPRPRRGVNSKVLQSRRHTLPNRATYHPDKCKRYAAIPALCLHTLRLPPRKEAADREEAAGTAQLASSWRRQ